MNETIFATLRGEHEAIRRLQDAILETSGADSTRPQLWARLRQVLVVHAKAEEAVLYDHLAQISTTAELAEHSTEEHRTIEEVVQQLEHLGFDQPQWLVTFRRLVDISCHHLDEEEEELFPVAGRVLSETDKRTLSGRYRETVQTMQQKHPLNDGGTFTGVRSGTYEARSVDDLRKLASEQEIPCHASMQKSELISALRGAPQADA